MRPGNYFFFQLEPAAGKPGLLRPLAVGEKVLHPTNEENEYQSLPWQQSLRETGFQKLCVQRKLSVFDADEAFAYVRVS